MFYLSEINDDDDDDNDDDDNVDDDDVVRPVAQRRLPRRRPRLRHMDSPYDSYRYVAFVLDAVDVKFNSLASIIIKL